MSPWPPAEHAFPSGGLGEFLAWCVGEGASDITFQTGRPALIEVDGRLRRATAAALDGPAIALVAGELYGAPERAEAELRAGGAIDCSHAVALGRDRRLRFRVNMAPALDHDRWAINITVRALPEEVPDFGGLGVEPGIVEAWDLRTGLNLVTGVPGSGKSTLLAAGTRRLLESGAGRIQTYESPVEFTFASVPQEGSLISQSEVPAHFRTFAEGLRSSLRRRPAAVVVGEARDLETVEAAVNCADFGIATFATAHTVGVAATVRRLLSEYPPDVRPERGAALVDVLHLVVTQALLPRPSGGRTALREWLVLDRALRNRLLDAPAGTWPRMLAGEVAARGTGLAAAADRALREGRIFAEDHRRIAAGAGEPQ